MPGTAPVVEQVRSLVRVRRERLAARFQWIRLALETMQIDRRMAGSVLAAGVAFRLFLMILPLALLVAAVLGFAEREVAGSPSQVARHYGLTFAIAQIIASSAGQASGGRWFLLATGLVLLLWTGNGLVQALSSAFRVAWNLDRARTSPLKGLIVVAGLALAVTATAATAALGAVSPARELPITAGLAVGYAAIWFVVSVQLPHGGSTSALVPGAILMALGFAALHLGTVLFAANRVARASQLYGSLGFVSTVMLWLFLSGRIMVGSAQLNATLWRRGGPQRRLNGRSGSI